MTNRSRLAVRIALLATSALGMSGAQAQTMPATGTEPSTASSPTQATQSSQADGADRQSAPEQEAAVEGDIVVTGIRQSLAKAIAVKRASSQIVDSIVAEDIGRLPDRTVAESLQRVSGVQVRRGIGDASSISIRGLRQNNILLNGRSVPDAAGRGGTGLDSIASGSYGLLARIPSELISRLDVVKLPAADDIEGALGGTVDIITRRPLDQPDLLVAGSLQGIYSERADRTGYRASALFSTRFADNRVGVILNGVYAKRYIREDSFESNAGQTPLTCAFNNNPGRIANRNSACAGTTVPTPIPTGALNIFDANGDGVPGFYTTDLRYQTTQDERETIAATTTIQWQPFDDLEILLDGLYSRLTSDRTRTWFSVPLAGTGASYTSAVLSANETLVSGVINARLQNNLEVPVNKGDTISGAISAKYNRGPVKVFAEYSYGRAKQNLDQFFLRSQSLTVVPVSFDLTTREIPTIGIPTTFDVTNPALFGFSNVFDSRNFGRTKEQAARIDFDIDLSDTGFVRSIETGVRYATLANENIIAREQYAPANLPVNGFPGSTEVFGVENFLGKQGRGGSPARFLVPVNRFAGDRTCQTLAPACLPGRITPDATYFLDESFLATYLKMNWAFDLGTVPVSGNVGVRYVTSDLTAAGSLRVSATSFVPINQKNNYEDVLPSAVLRVDLTDRFTVRAGAAKILARGSSAELSPALTLTLTNNPPTGVGGDPTLDPFRAEQYDLSFEWYYQPGAILSVGLFYKDIESFISTQVFREFLPVDTREFLVTRRTNGQGGSVKGVEALFQIPFTFLPAPLDGFGVTGTYSYTDSKTPLVNSRANNEPLPLEGLSKHNVNIIGFYEKGPFGVRVAYNWRDRYLDRIGPGGAGVFYDNYDNLSVTARFDFSENVGIDLEAANVTDSGLRRYDGVKEDTRSYSNYGRSYSATIRARF